MYESIGIDYRSKALIYSDSLSVDKCLSIKKQTDELGFEHGELMSSHIWLSVFSLLTSPLTKVSFGIGTFFTNDFRTVSTGEKSKALNIVIKLASVDGNPCIKLSDDLTKVSV